MYNQIFLDASHIVVIRNNLIIPHYLKSVKNPFLKMSIVQTEEKCSLSDTPTTVSWEE
jgi:hypothetical protein